MFILLLSLMGVTLSSDYECQGFPKVAVAMYGMTGVYFLEIVVSFFLVRLGWQGSCLDERKRMPQMTVIIHVWFAIEVLKFFLTIWGIVVVYSPTVSSQCWSNNPCESYVDQLPRVCVPGATGAVQLTTECQVIFTNKHKYSTCFERWAEFGAGWMLDNFISSNLDPPYVNFSFPGTLTCRTDVPWQTDKRLSEMNPFDPEQNIFWYIGEELERIDDEQRVQAPENISLMDTLPNAYQILTTNVISNGISYKEPEIPWNDCLDDSCKKLLQNSCSQWRDFIVLPDTHQLAGWFAAVMFISLAECILTGLIFFISFNAFPDYESQESWQGLLSGFAKRLGYGGDLQATSTDNGVDALVEIGRLLFTLFGGADLDVTDVILGVYLVHLKQKWKRKAHALSYLAKHGYIGQEQQVSVWRSKLAGFILFPLFIDGYYKKINQEAPSIMDIGKHTMSGDEELNMDDTLESINTTGGVFDQLSSEIKQVKSFISNSDTENTSDSVLMLQYSMAHLKSIESHVVDEATVILRKQERPLITPLNLMNVRFKRDGENISGDILTKYLGNASPSVKLQQLENLIHFLPIARASYGLMRCKWRSCIEPGWKHTILNRVFHVFKGCLPSTTVSSYFQERNLKQILRIVNMQIEDILYVSYTSNPLGEIPYLILIDSSTKNVCMSMRGTVGIADLITDLLSSPANVANDSQGSTYAHAGMMSSARAIITDLKSKGIWDALNSQEEAQASNQKTVLSSDDENSRFPIPKALKLIREAIHKKGYGLVVTGHSLGAGVACLVASELRSIRPHVKCIAFNPPGGLLNDTLRQDSQSFCTSVVCGQDAISRMSIGTMKRLIDDMMFALASCKRPKLSVLLDSVIGRYSNTSASSHIFNRFEDIEPYIIDVLLQYLRESKIHQENVDEQAMYPPGKIVFLRPYGDLSESKSLTWDAVWVNAHGK